MIDFLEFQIIDWNSYHEKDETYTYIIQLFGRTLDDKDVCLKLVGFTPFFYDANAGQSSIINLNPNSNESYDERTAEQDAIEKYQLYCK